jgi:CPA2 family monovalent cation:H+ antiporter-2
MRTLVFGLGSSQVLLTIAGTLLGHFALAFIYGWLTGLPWRMSWQGAVVLGGAIAMSSTAIVVKLMRIGNSNGLFLAHCWPASAPDPAGW